MTLYYMIYTHKGGDGRQYLMNTGMKAVAANEDNKQLLIEMGEKLLYENIIESYQLLAEAAPEVSHMSKYRDFEEAVDLNDAMMNRT